MIPAGRISYPGQPIDSANSPQSVQLKSGQIWVIPQGNFIIRPGAQSAIQWFDTYAGLWRILQSSLANAPIPVASDGTNFRVINTSGTIEGVTITNAGTNYVQATTAMTFAAPVAPGVTAIGTPIVGGNLSFAVTAGGTGYINPYILIDPPQLWGGVSGLCLPATANLTVSAGVITAVNIGFAGAGYVSVPNVTVVDAAGGGTGAVITPTVGGAGTITGAIITNPGSLYDGTHIPAVTFTGAGASAAATALPNMALTSVTVAGTNTGYSGTPFGETSLGVVAASVMGEPKIAREAKVVFSLTAGAISGQTIEDPGSGFQSVPAFAQLVNAGSNATFTAVVGGVTNSTLYWQVG